MRQSYLESYYNVIPKSQQDRLLSILKSRYDDAGQTAPDSASLNKQLEFLIAQLNKPLGEPLIQLRKAAKYGKIVSKDYNSTMEEAYVDLGALFKQNNTINKTIKTHRLLNETVLRDIRAALGKVENDIKVHKVIKENKSGITDVKYNSFYKNDNMSTDKVYAADVDLETDSVKLPLGVDQSSLSLEGLAMAEIDVFHFGGGIRGTIEDESHRKEKAIDGSSETFWGEVILTDEPIRQTYAGTTYFGTICEVVITMFRPDLVNHIKFNPFTNYPLTIVGIYYNTSIGGSWIDTGITSQTSTETMEFNFSEVLAKQVKIVLNQKNPSINTYKIPRKVVNNAQMWQQIVDREYSITTESENPIQATQDMIDYVTGWKAYVDAQKGFEDKIKDIGKPDGYVINSNMSETLFDAATKEMTKAGGEDATDPLKLDLYQKKIEPDNELIEVRKYEYTFGAYNIELRKRWYMELGEYISPMYIPNGTVVEASLSVTEVVPSGTSIEYQVATRPEEWVNILPSGGFITKERLDLDRVTQKGYLRFPVDGTIDSVYRSDDFINSSNYSYTPSTQEIVIGSGWYTPTSSFTVSYLPKGVSDVTPSGVVVNFLGNSLLETDETYQGTGSRQYKVSLQHYPYVDYAIINDTSKANATSPHFVYEEGRWYNSSGGSYSGIAADNYYDIMTITVDGYSAINRTDYYENIRPALTTYNVTSYPYFEYLHAGKNLYFNTPLESREVKVKYKYLNDFIQLRALLRNNNRSNVSVTPILQDYTLKLRTI
jgi:hypothetical protein